MLSPEEFHYSFTNTLTAEESVPVCARYAVPGPGLILFQAALANFNSRVPTRVDFNNDDRAPLLSIGGGVDHIVPPAVTKAAAATTETPALSPSTESSLVAPTTRWARKAGKK